VRHRGLVEALVTVKAWRTLLLAALATALGAYIYLVERPKLDTEGAEEHLVTFDPAEVTRLDLRYPGEPEISLVRDGAEWHLAEPIQTAADGPTVDRLVDQIAKIKVERRIKAADAQPLATYGLEGDGERAKVDVTLADGKVVPAIVVGKTTPVGYQAFVRLGDSNEVVVTPLIFHTGVKKTVLELRDKKLFAFDQDTISRIRIRTADATLDIERDGDDWRITSPIADRAEPGQIATLLSSIASMTAIDYYDGAAVDKPAFGLDAPSATVTLTAKDGTSTEFAIGKAAATPPSGVYLERLGDGQVVKAPDWVDKRFAADPTPYRDKHLFFCDPNEITRMSFERADGDDFVLFEDEAGEWQMDPPPTEGRVVRSSVVTRRRGGLVALAGDAIVAEKALSSADRASYGLDKPQVTVELTLRDGSSCGRAAGAVVDAGSEQAKYYVIRLADSLIMSVPQYQYSRINALRDDFLESNPPVGAPVENEP